MKTILIILISINCFAQCPESLTTTYADNNGATGIMFDVTAFNTITIKNFDANLHPMVYSQGWDIELYYKTGTHIGNETNLSAWSLIGSVNMGTITPWGLAGQPAEIPIPINLTISSGQTYAFYITCVQNAGVMLYTNGNTATQDSNLSIEPGTGIGNYPIPSVSYYPKKWNGTINYTTNCQVLRTLEYVANTFCWSNFTPPDCQTQRININEGWNLISTYLDMTNVGIDQIFGIIPDVLIVKNGSGEAYISSLGINTIGNWNQKDGYKIKAVSDVVFDMCFTENLDNSISLPIGWSLISVLSDVPVDPVSLFNGTSLLICKNIAGQSYIPSLGINTIGDFEPSQGYKVKMGTADVISY